MEVRYPALSYLKTGVGQKSQGEYPRSACFLGSCPVSGISWKFEFL